jgi:thiosulfate/3-mercaptopyruvate sulfurtransferase
LNHRRGCLGYAVQHQTPALQGATSPSAGSDVAADKVVWDGIVDCAQFRTRLGQRALVVLDCRHDLARPEWGEQQYRLGHIPGAVFVHLDRDLAGPTTGFNGRHPLPDRETLAASLRSWGISAASQVVVYDASEGAYAARAWWLLRWLGHGRVAVLDGGWTAWLAAALPVSGELPSALPGDFQAGTSLQAVAELAAVMAVAGAAAVPPPERFCALLLDARAPDRFAGRNETVDPVAGHIPGALNRYWKQNLDGEGRFKSAALLHAEYSALLGGRSAQQVIVQCGSGVTACHDALALHLAGLPGAALYPGSWSHWIADPSRPIATGP